MIGTKVAHINFLFVKFPNILFDIRGGIKITVYFSFRITPKGGGGLAESKISLSEKTEIILEFFL